MRTTLLFPLFLFGFVALSFAEEVVSPTNIINSTAQDGAVSHSFDLESHMPPHLAIMFSMSWFGIPSDDPQGAGPDPSYGNWYWLGPKCVQPVANPKICNEDLTPGSMQRAIASKRRPLAGIYSASARDWEGIARVKLMLANLRRPCDDGAKLDAWSVQIDSLRFTSRYPKNRMSITSDIAYRALLGFLNQGDANGLKSVVMPGQDATWYFHFGNDFGMGKCDNSPNNPMSNCLDALQSDLTDMVNIADTFSSAYRINGKLVILYYLDAQYASPAQFATIFNNVRSKTGKDFYTIATTEHPAYFEAFDAIAPWINLGQWSDTKGSSVYNHALAWVAQEHQNLLDQVVHYPGRVVFGSASPGFDDYTMDWGDCKSRELPSPPNKPRDPSVLNAEFAFFKAKGIKGIVCQTWDDWTEGTAIEPDVVGGPTVLVQLRQQLGILYGEPSDPSGDARLAHRWLTYGQARNCKGGRAGIPPDTNLNCTLI